MVVTIVVLVFSISPCYLDLSTLECKVALFVPHKQSDHALKVPCAASAWLCGLVGVSC